MLMGNADMHQAYIIIYDSDSRWLLKHTQLQ